MQMQILYAKVKLRSCAPVNETETCFALGLRLAAVLVAKILSKKNISIGKDKRCLKWSKEKSPSRL